MKARLTPISEVIQELGLPNDSQFIGYVIYFPERDDYFFLTIEDDDADLRGFSPTPHLAKVFDDYDDALGMASRFGRFSEVSLLFDTGPEYMVFPVL
ncbi:MAG TPA: hypothetical protein VJ961_02805 [Mariprofundaceae bacterium]|nr:hypothetical protein [Mariprofundaceae bacterium]